MNTEIEDRLALSLRDRADRDVDTGTLLTGAVRQGRRRLVRQRVGWLGVIVLLIAGMVSFGALRPYPVGGHHPVTPTSHGPSASLDPRPGPGPTGVWDDLTPRPLDSALVPPAASADTPTALQDPGAVGTDPGLLHLDVAALPGHYVAADWTSGPGLEKLLLTDTDEQARAAASASNTAASAAVYLAAGAGRVPGLADGAVADGTFLLGRATVTDYLVGGGTSVQDHEGTPQATYRMLRWQPAAGLTVELTATADDRKARQLATAVRLDTVRRCVVPFRLTDPPAGSGLTCELTLATAGADAGLGASYTMASGTGRLTVSATRYRGTGNACVVTDGNPSPVQLGTGTARWFADGPDGGHLEVCQPVGGLVVGANLTGTGYQEADVVRAVAGLRAASEPDRPDTWPASPLS